MAAHILLCIVFIPVLVVWCVQWTFHLGAIIYGKWLLHRKTTRSPDDKSLPGVSILKPLSGVDSNLAENLESFFTTHYPNFELLFCIENEGDEAIPLVQKLMTNYPDVDARLFMGGRNVGMNPKINNMITGYEAAKYNLLLISDAGIQMRKDTLLAMVETLKEDTGLVHQMPYCLYRPGFAASLEMLYFGTYHAKYYLFNDFLGINCACGMSCLYRKNVLDEVGGLQAFCHYLAEDFHLSRVVMEKGYKIRICPQYAQQNNGTISVEIFKARMVRWIKLRGSLMPYVYLLEPISECFVLGILVSLALNFFFGIHPFISIIGHVLSWLVLDYILMNIIEGGPLPFSKRVFLRAWLYREINAFYLWTKALSNSSVKWRAKEYKLRWHGIAEPVQSPKFN